MKVYANQLERHLKSHGLPPVILVSGDEPLQMAECCDAIRQQARSVGYLGREVLHVEKGFDWGELAREANALSLFAEQRIIELRLTNAKPGIPGGKALQAYCAAPAPDTILLITMGKLEPAASKSKWCQAIDSAGFMVQLWPVERAQLPRWIEQRMRKVGLQPEGEVAAVLADRVEGNLLAASQEIEKLLLLIGQGRLDVAQLLSVVADSARYDVFTLVDAALLGDAARVIKIVNGLRAEGGEPVLVLWALSREIRTLLNIAYEARRGGVNDALLRRYRIWDKRKAVISSALQRYRYPHWVQMLEQCAEIDRMIKGQSPGNPWDELNALAMRMAGIRLPRAPVGL